MKKKILIIGATGMLGNAQLTELVKYDEYEVFATVRSFTEAEKLLPKKLLPYIIPNVDVENSDSLAKVLIKTKPNFVINCVGLIKQVKDAGNVEMEVSLNALFPHRLARLCDMVGAKLIQISTDCVFSGATGFYSEQDKPDPKDSYGQTKLLGEVGAPHFTMRTSILGHGLENFGSLIDWFLSQKQTTKGFTKAIYSGFPTIEIAQIIAEYIIPNEKLTGLYHISSDPISKYELLKMVAKTYHKKIKIEADETVAIDRSLNSDLFRKATGYQPPKWEDLLKKMYKYYKTNPNFLSYKKEQGEK
jgi:dTDP-4-dehydrorhamnose reductase